MSSCLFMIFCICVIKRFLIWILFSLFIGYCHESSKTLNSNGFYIYKKEVKHHIVHLAIWKKTCHMLYNVISFFSQKKAAFPLVRRVFFIQKIYNVVAQLTTNVYSLHIYIGVLPHAQFFYDDLVMYSIIF